jgi:hypothetical protein
LLRFPGRSGWSQKECLRTSSLWSRLFQSSGSHTRKSYWVQHYENKPDTPWWLWFRQFLVATVWHSEPVHYRDGVDPLKPLPTFGVAEIPFNVRQNRCLKELPQQIASRQAKQDEYGCRTATK